MSFHLKYFYSFHFIFKTCILNGVNGIDLFPITHMEYRNLSEINYPDHIHLRFDDRYAIEDGVDLKVFSNNFLSPHDYTKSLSINLYCMGNYQEKVWRRMPLDMEYLFFICPNRCNANPCLYIENAFEYSCSSDYVLKRAEKVTYSIGKIDKQMIDQWTDSWHHHTFKCECFSGFEWIENDKNDSGGTCERTKHLITCKTIECVIGLCVIIENKEKCNSFVFK